MRKHIIFLLIITVVLSACSHKDEQEGIQSKTEDIETVRMVVDREKYAVKQVDETEKQHVYSLSQTNENTGYSKLMAKMSKYAPQKIVCNIKAGSQIYLDIPMSGKIEQLETYDIGESQGVFYLIGTSAYNVAFSEGIEPQMVSDKCKKIFYDYLNKALVYLDTDGKVYSNNENILNNVQDVWRTNDGLIYLRDNNLYIHQEDKDVLLIEDCGLITSLTSRGNSSLLDIVYVNDKNEVYMCKRAGYKKRLDLSFDIKKVLYHYEYSDLLWMLDVDGNLYYLDETAEKIQFIEEDVEELLENNPYDDVKILRKGNVEFIRVNSDNKTIIKSIQHNKIEVMLEDGNVTQEGKLIVELDGLGSVKCDKENIFAKQKWVTYYVENTSFYSPANYHVASNVSNLSHNFFVSNNQLKRFNAKGKIEKYDAVKDITDIYGSNCYRSYIVVDNDGDVYLRRYSFVEEKNSFFLYKYNDERKTFAKNNLELVEDDVEKLWVNEYGTAFIRNNKLYAYGTLELNREVYNFYEAAEEGYEDYVKYPDKLVLYSGIDTKNIRDVSFSWTTMYVTMKDGSVYEITPEQEAFNFDTRKYTYPSERKITSEHLLDVQDVREYGEKYYIDNNNVATIKFREQEHKVNNVKSVHFSSEADTCFVLQTDGTLYGFGENKLDLICIDGADDISFENRVLIDENVSEISTYMNGLYILKNNKKLYFRGYNDYL